MYTLRRTLLERDEATMKWIGQKDEMPKSRRRWSLEPKEGFKEDYIRGGYSESDEEFKKRLKREAEATRVTNENFRRSR